MSHQLWFGTRSSVLIDTKYSVFFSNKFLNQNNSVGSGDQRKSPNQIKEYVKKINSKLLNFRKTPILTKIF